MDGEQAARWAAAQEEVPVGVDLVAAALRQLEFLAAVDRRRWLYEGPLLDRAIRRYKACWLPLLAKHTNAPVVDGPLVVPLDCEWIWHCHRLNPVQYLRDCKKVYGRILNNDNVESSTGTKSKIQSQKIWKELYPEEPFELEYSSSSETTMDVNPGATDGISYDLVSAVKRQSSFYYQFWSMMTLTLIDLKGRSFDVGFTETTEQFEGTFGVRYWKAGCMYRGNTPSPVTSTPHIFNAVGVNGSDTYKVQKGLNVLNITFVEDLTGPDSKLSFERWFELKAHGGHATSPPVSLRVAASATIKLYRGRKLEYERNCCKCHSEDDSAVTAVKFCAEYPYGKAVALLDKESKLITVNEDGFLLPWITISFLCMEADGEDDVKFISGAMDQKVAESESDTAMVSETETLEVGSAAVVPAQCGTCSTAFDGEKVMAAGCKSDHDSSEACQVAIASCENGHADSAGVGAGYGGSCGPVVVEEFKVDNAKSGGCGSGCGGGCSGGRVSDTLVRASTTAGEGQAKSAGCGSGCGGGCGSGMVIGGSKTSHAKSSGCGSGCGGGCGGGMVIEGSKTSHANAGGCGSGCGGGCGSGMVIEGSKTGQAKAGGCGSGCGGGCGGGMVIEGSKTSHAKSGGCGSGCGGGCGGGSGLGTLLNSSTTADQGLTKSGGCGSGCGGGCGSGMAVEGSKTTEAKSGGCGSGCGGGGCGTMVIEGSKTNHAKSSGCGSGCGGGCGGSGGGFGTLFNSSTAVGEAKSGGCGSGCGSGGCGGGIMVIEGSKSGYARSGGCGSGCGGGCGNGIILNASTMPGGEGHSKSGGCGSGCGGGCGGGIMVIEGSKSSYAKSGGCGSGCGGGCGNGIIFNSSTKAGAEGSRSKSGGCGSGCGGGGCGGGCGTSMRDSICTAGLRHSQWMAAG
ncbi:hypothetical protein HU200_044092 [Digitaria exilis]|uniref:GRPD C-terminal domain-containing protein n=1 Tax=Digitaria exilis TaxID=1010633 RepID=A0A835B297_9POAL|nr:hypothetical protein HU200_044092 [Digitaria exilis]